MFFDWVNNWAIELQESEFGSLYFLLVRLNNQLMEIKDNLLDEELITLEIEQLPWYLKLEGKNEWFKLIFESQD